MLYAYPISVCALVCSLLPIQVFRWCLYSVREYVCCVAVAVVFFVFVLSIFFYTEFAFRAKVLRKFIFFCYCIAWLGSALVCLYDDDGNAIGAFYVISSAFAVQIFAIMNLYWMPFSFVWP